VSRPDDKRLDDIVEATIEIADIVARGRAAFDEDVALRRAMERCLEIVGEAAKSLSADVRDSIPNVSWSQVIRLRDRLSHHYHRVEADLVWVTRRGRHSTRGGGDHRVACRPRLCLRAAPLPISCDARLEPDPRRDAVEAATLTRRGRGLATNAARRSPRSGDLQVCLWSSRVARNGVTRVWTTGSTTEGRVELGVDRVRWSRRVARRCRASRWSGR
jgi:uncharacterized protein with HEPN domain